MPLPPWGEVWDLLRLLLAPVAGVSLVLMLAVRCLGGERLAPLAAAAAVAAGVLVGNYFREAMLWRIDSDRPLNCRDLRTALGWSLESKPVTEGDEGESLPVPPARYWLPWLAGLALVIDLLARVPGVPVTLGWVARTLLAMLAGRLLTPPDLRVDLPWASWALGGTILLEWAVLTALTKKWKDGTVATVVAVCFAAAGVVLLHAHSARLTDMALLLFTALAGPALVAWIWRGDTGGAMPAIAVFLPALMLAGQQETFSDVPDVSFLLLGLAPLALAPALLPVLVRQERGRRWLLAALPLIPATVAVVLAVRAESLQF